MERTELVKIVHLIYKVPITLLHVARLEGSSISPQDRQKMSKKRNCARAHTSNASAAKILSIISKRPWWWFVCFGTFSSSSFFNNRDPKISAILLIHPKLQWIQVQFSSGSTNKRQSLDRKHFISSYVFHALARSKRPLCLLTWGWGGLPIKIFFFLIRNHNQKKLI